MIPFNPAPVTFY